MKGQFFITIKILVATCCLLPLFGCEDNFQPIKENREYIFSIYGYLDASADTQWVRVSPAREQLEMPPEVPDMKVTLEHLETGSTVVMNDSLFVENGANLLNFWTDMEIENGQTYQLKAERPDGASSHVSVTIPKDFTTPRVQKVTRYWGLPPAYKIFVTDVERLVDLRTRWYVQIDGEKKVISFSHRDEVVELTAYGGAYLASVVPAEELDEIHAQTLGDSEVQILHKQFYVASGGPEWSEEIISTDDLLYALPGGISNVKNGLGYMVGIDSKSVPFKSCYNENSLLIPCIEEEPYW